MNEQITRLTESATTFTEAVPLSGIVKAVLKYYKETIAVPQIINIGPVTRLSPRYKGDEPPRSLREYKVEYPPSLNEAYAIVCEQHDEALMQVVEDHKEWTTDYHYAPRSLAFQVDGPAYPDQFLQYVANMHPQVLAEFLRGRIFEVENNIAGYDLNGRLWPDGTTNTTWYRTLDELRQRTGKKVAVLASTDEKFNAMLFSELGGVARKNLPSEEEIRALTGFDTFMGPDELIVHYNKYSGQDSDYVFFGRTSRSTVWLEHPTMPVDEPFLRDPELLKYVREYAITHNFDNPQYSLFDPRVITDTKAALVAIGSAHKVTKIEDILSQEFLIFIAERNLIPEKVVCIDDQLSEKRKKLLGKYISKFLFNYPRTAVLNPKFLAYLESIGGDSIAIANGTQRVRVKPLRRHYGAWAHIKNSAIGVNFASELMNEVKLRGPFALQPEFQNLEVIDKNTRIHYSVIDRVFFVRGSDGLLRRMEGVRAFMPKDSPEGQKNNVHDGRDTLDAAIVE